MAIVLDGTTGITNDGGYTGDGIVFADTAPANTLVTTTGGNVGIGTSSPGQVLEVRGLGSAGGQNGAYVLQTLYDNTAGAINVGGGIGFAGNDGVNSRVTFATINGSKENSTSGNFASYMSFKTRADAGALTERARIDSSGNVGIGTSSPTARFHVVSNPDISLPMRNNNTASGTASATSMAFQRNGTNVGLITVTGTTTSYETSSDYRLKHDIQPMTGALAKVAALKPVTYKWNVDNSESQGFIAHELQEIVPECVSGEKDAVDAEGNPRYQGIDTSFLVATLTAAIQELKGINDAQAQIITALTARVEALEGAQA